MDGKLSISVSRQLLGVKAKYAEQQLIQMLTFRDLSQGTRAQVFAVTPISRQHMNEVKKWCRHIQC